MCCHKISSSFQKLNRQGKRIVYRDLIQHHLLLCQKKSKEYAMIDISSFLSDVFFVCKYRLLFVSAPVHKDSSVRHEKTPSLHIIHRSKHLVLKVLIPPSRAEGAPSQSLSPSSKETPRIQPF